MNDLSPASDAAPAAAGTAPAQTAAFAFATEPGAQGTLREGASGDPDPRVRSGSSGVGRVPRPRRRSEQLQRGGNGDEAPEDRDDRASLYPQGAVEVGAELGKAGLESSEVGFRRRFEADDIGLCRERVTVRGGGPAQRFGVRFGLAAFDSGRFEGAGGTECIEGGGVHVDSFRVSGSFR